VFVRYVNRNFLPWSLSLSRSVSSWFSANYTIDQPGRFFYLANSKRRQCYWLRPCCRLLQHVLILFYCTWNLTCNEINAAINKTEWNVYIIAAFILFYYTYNHAFIQRFWFLIFKRCYVTTPPAKCRILFFKDIFLLFDSVTTSQLHYQLQHTVWRWKKSFLPYALFNY